MRVVKCGEALVVSFHKCQPGLSCCQGQVRSGGLVGRILTLFLRQGKRKVLVKSV
jgi:hypothetical protein